MAITADVGLRLRRLFEQLDVKKDGHVNKRELIKGLYKNNEVAELFGLPRKIKQEDGSREDFERVFQGIDHNDDRTIDWEEFYDFFAHHQATVRKNVADMMALTNTGTFSVSSAKFSASTPQPASQANTATFSVSSAKFSASTPQRQAYASYQVPPQTAPQAPPMQQPQMWGAPQGMGRAPWQQAPQNQPAATSSITSTRPISKEELDSQGRFRSTYPGNYTSAAGAYQASRSSIPAAANPDPPRAITSAASLPGTQATRIFSREEQPAPKESETAKEMRRQVLGRNLWQAQEQDLIRRVNMLENLLRRTNELPAFDDRGRNLNEPTYENLDEETDEPIMFKDVYLGPYVHENVLGELVEEGEAKEAKQEKHAKHSVSPLLSSLLFESMNHTGNSSKLQEEKQEFYVNKKRFYHQQVEAKQREERNIESWRRTLID